MSTDKETCANCGRGEEESSSLKNCTACKMVKYCSRDCQKAHRSQHKKECRKRAAELHDEALFRQPPPREEDCPICFMRMPSFDTGWKYNSCCGKIICSGCVYAGKNMEGNADQLCPFCRTPAPKTDEVVERVKKRVEVGDAKAMNSLGMYYSEGMYGMPQDMDEALKLWDQAAVLGHADSYCNTGNAYFYGRGVERDEKKATHYYELAAMGGDEYARHNLGNAEANSGNYGRALRHYMIAVGGGFYQSLTTIKQQYTGGLATRDDYATALKAYQAYLAEIKSDDRDKAAAFNDRYTYYE